MKVVKSRSASHHWSPPHYLPNSLVSFLKSPPSGMNWFCQVSFADDGATQNWYEENTFIFSPITLEDIVKEHSEETFDKVFKFLEGFLEGWKEVLNHRS